MMVSISTGQSPVNIVKRLVSLEPEEPGFIAPITLHRTPPSDSP